MKNNIKLSKIKQIFDKLGLDTNNLQDSAVLERKQLDLKPSDNETCIAMISSINVDSDGDIVIPSGIDFSIYKKNPVVFFQHNYSLLPAGKIEDIEVLSNGVRAKIKLATVTSMGADIWALIKGGFLKACSIGFVATEWLNVGEKNFDYVLNQLKEAGHNVEGCMRIITKCIMYENSIVGLPANSDALIDSVTLKSLNHKNLKQLNIKGNDESSDNKIDNKDSVENIVNDKVQEQTEQSQEVKPDIKPDIAPIPETLLSEEQVAIIKEDIEECNATQAAIDQAVIEEQVKQDEKVTKDELETRLEEVKQEEAAIEFLLDVIDHIPTEEEINIEVENMVNEEIKSLDILKKEIEAKNTGKLFLE